MCIGSMIGWFAERGIRPRDVIVVGYSIGTGPAVELAASRPVGGLILESAYLSAPRIVTRVRILPCDPFPNLSRIGKIRCPLLMIHGTDDRTVPFVDGCALYDLAPEPKRLIAVDGAGHDDFVWRMGADEYCAAVLRFFDACAP